MDVAGSGLLEITAEYESFRLGKEVDGDLYREADPQWFRAILSGVVENQKVVDPVIRQALTEDWPLSRLDSTLRAILRAGVYELMKRKDVPVAVIVSEYVDIAKAFYEDDEPKLVNAVLDRVAIRTARRRAFGRRANERARHRSTGQAQRDRPRVSQAVVGAAAPITISLGGLAGYYLLAADKSLATAPVTGFNIGVALGACPPPRLCAARAPQRAS
jgi:transcription antitermination protein NusB